MVPPAEVVVPSTGEAGDAAEAPDAGVEGGSPAHSLPEPPEGETGLHAPAVPDVEIADPEPSQSDVSGGAQDDPPDHSFSLGTVALPPVPTPAEVDSGPSMSSAGELPSEEPGAPEEPTASEPEQTAAPPVEIPSTDEAEGAYQAPGRGIDKDLPAHPVPEPVETGAGQAAPAVPEAEVAEPPQAETGGGARHSPDEPVPGEAGALQVSLQPAPAEPASGPAEPWADDARVEERSAAATAQAVASEPEPAAVPPTQVEVPSAGETDDAYQAPGAGADEISPAHLIREPTETVAGEAELAALEVEVAEPALSQADVSGEAHPSDAVPAEADALLALLPAAEVAAGAAILSSQPIEVSPALHLPDPPRPLDPPRRSVPTWLPPQPPSREAVEGLLPYLRLALRAAAAVALGFAVVVLTLIVLYRWVDPPASTLMLGQRLGGTPIERRWVPLDRISRHLIKAVVLSEDGAFCRHNGVDWRALEEAIEDDRGGSTITMQVVKNLFLWPSRSYVRKALEFPLAYLVELIWPKRRILEIYLNVAEWGDGVFGAEAAAHEHFRKPAARLTAREAALLAVSLPNPLERTAGRPSAGTRRLAARLLARMRLSRVNLACVRAPRRR